MYALAQHTFSTPKGNLAHMTYRTDSSDWNTVSSVMQPHDEYGLASQTVEGRAADVGAHIGSVTIALLLDNPGLFVIAVEPVPPNVVLLRRNLAQNGLTDRCQVWEGAVGSGKTTTIRYGYRGNESAEHHAFIGNSSFAGGRGKVPHDTAKVPVFGPAEFGPLDLMKIDCEGGEWTFFEAGIPDARVILGEWHPVKGHTLADMASLLGESYVVTFSGPQTGPGGFRAVRR